MSYSVQRNDRAGLVLVAFSGHAHLAARSRALDDLEGLVTSTGLRRVLVDFSASASFGAMTMDEALRHARRLADLSARLPDLRIAYVYPPGQPPVVELIAASRGFRFERFTRRHAALEWLAFDREAMRSAA